MAAKGQKWVEKHSHLDERVVQSNALTPATHRGVACSSGVRTTDHDLT